MTDLGYRRMKRSELIEQLHTLQRREQELKTELTSLKQKLDDRAIKMNELGSIAEASLAVSQVFEDAQAAADLYVAEAKERLDSSEAEREKLIASARLEAQSIISSASFKAENTRKQAEQDAVALVRKTEADIRSQWQLFQTTVSRSLETNTRYESERRNGSNHDSAGSSLEGPYVINN